MRAPPSLASPPTRAPPPSNLFPPSPWIHAQPPVEQHDAPSPCVGPAASSLLSSVNSVATGGGGSSSNPSTLSLCCCTRPPQQLDPASVILPSVPAPLKKHGMSLHRCCRCRPPLDPVRPLDVAQGWPSQVFAVRASGCGPISVRQRILAGTTSSRDDLC